MNLPPLPNGVHKFPRDDARFYLESDVKTNRVACYEAGFRRAWIVAAEWAVRDDLIAAIGGPEYKAELNK